MESKESAYFLDACRRGEAVEVEQLCALFPHLVNNPDARAFTPLILAVYNNQPAVVDVLLANGADTNAQDSAGNTALMGACYKGHDALVDKLLKAGADVNLRNFQGAPALTFAATFGQLAIARTLLQHGAHTNLPDARGKTALDHAVLQENEEMIALLQQHVDQ